MNHNIIKLLLLSCICLTSCSKSFLESPPATDISRQGYLNSLNACNEYLNGLYIDITTKFYYPHGAIYGDVVADNIKPAKGRSEMISQYNWNQLATTDAPSVVNPLDVNMNGYWATAGRIVRGCNFLIEKTDEFSTEDQDKAKNIKGQAYAIRALLFHAMINVFAQPFKFTAGADHPGIPYFKSPDWTQSVKRGTVAENYTDLITDLNQAIQLIPEGNSNKKIISRNAAKALLARIYLFKGDFEKAKALAMEINKAVPIMTGASNYPAKLFTPDESEALFQIPPYSTGYNSLFPSYYFRNQTYIATDDITGVLQERPKDVRNNWVTLTGGLKMISKFPMNIVPGIAPNGTNSYYYTVIRSSEMYLTAAESYAQLGMEDSARYYLDAIRKRADVTIAATQVSGTALLDSIYKERRKEFCFENLRMFDLLRVGKGVNRTDADVSPGMKSLSYPSPKAISPIHQVDAVYYGLQQNTSY